MDGVDLQKIRYRPSCHVADFRKKAKLSRYKEPYS